MTITTSVLIPTAASAPQAEQAGRTLATLRGCVVGFVDNAKPNFHYLVDDLAELLVSEYGVARIVKRRKRAASIPAPVEMIDELAKSCDLVITGSGD